MKQLISLTLAALVSIGGCSNSDPQEEKAPPAKTIRKILMTVGTTIFTVSLVDSEAAVAFCELLPLTISMDDVNNNEKFCRLSQNLPGTPQNPGTIHRGDLMIFNGNGLVLFYKTFQTSYSYMRLGTIDNPSGLEVALDRGSVRVSFELNK